MQDDAQALVHARALRGRLDAKERRVGGQRAGPDAEHRAAAREVVEQDDAVGDVERVVIRDADDARAEPYALCAFAGGREEDFGRGDDLPTAGVVLADPCLVEAELVEPGDEVDVAPQRQRGVLARAVERCHEDAEIKPPRDHAILLERARNAP